VAGMSGLPTGPARAWHAARMFRGRRRKREHELGQQDSFRTARRFMHDDVTALGDQLAELQSGTAEADLGHEGRDHWQQAIEHYDKAKHLLATSTTAEEIIGVEQVVADARWHRAAVLALRDGELVTQRRAPCFFDAHHGPSITDVAWTPPAGPPQRTVAVCAADARRLADGEAPATRLVRVADRYMPWHEIGGLAGLLRHAQELRKAASPNTGRHSDLTSHPSFNGAEGLGGGDNDSVRTAGG